MESIAFFVYATLYALAVVGCGVALRQARTIEDPDTRRGLVGLLVTSGGWGLFELGFIVAPTPDMRYVSYLLSLVVGLTTIGAWLYFCSAYTGRSFHRTAGYRRAAVGVYLAIVAVKVTNPLHDLYFTLEYTATPFAHPTVQHGVVHWLVAGLSYTLAGVGFFMLYELFLEADYDTRPLGALAAVTAVPVAFDVMGFTTPWLLDINYEPLGVAVFAVGTLYFFADRFLAVQLTDGVEEPVVYLDDDDCIQECNGRARRLFPSLADGVGEPLDAVAPHVAAALDDEDGIVECDDNGETGYYLVTDTTFALGQSNIGRLIVLTDVTDTERKRRELERHNEQLEGFAAGIRHELLNTLNVVQGRTDMAGRALNDGDVHTARDSLAVVGDTADRMAEVVDDFARLARHGRTLERTESVLFRTAVEEAVAVADIDDLSVTIDGDGTVEADPARLEELLVNGFQFAAQNDATTARVTLADDGFTLTTDGDMPPTSDTADLFAYGIATPGPDADMRLPNVRLLARTHGWDVSLTAADGLDITITGATIQHATAA
jgi:hypothetical protein